MAATRVLRLLTTCPYTNLATEEALFAALPAGSRVVLFYQNTASIVLGRTQNPFYEASLAHARERNVRVLRRRSGGGTVVHDLGNLNVCFMTPAAEFDPKANVRRIVDGLVGLGIERGRVGGSERGDIAVGGRKVSGSAYRFSRGRSYHHATLLVDSDLCELSRCLRSELRERLVVSGAESVRSAVTNLVDEAETVGVEALKVDDVVRAVGALFGDGVEEVGAGGPGGLVEGGAVERETAALREQAWVYGQCPRFSARFPDGVGGDVVLFMEKGCVVGGVQRLSGSDVAAVTVGSAKRRGSLGAADERLDCATLTAALAGVPFCGEAFRAQARQVGGDLGQLVERIAAHVPVQHVC